MKVSCTVTIETKVLDAVTKRRVGGNRRKTNLVLDQGLNAMARSSANGLSCTPASATTFCQTGSGNNANSFNSPGITFTQVGTTLTASGGFFTSAMVGGIFKYGSGTGGTEVYITAFTSTTIVTVSGSATVVTPTAGTVWMVQQTALQAISFVSNTYQTNSGDCGSTIAGNTITHKRTYIFGQQITPYTVNEIGWSSTNNAARCLGRLVLSSSDNVGTSNIYIVIISLAVTYTPNAPTAVVNFGTNINTAGNAMMEWFAVQQVNSTGGVASSSDDILDGSNSPELEFALATYTQNASIQTSASLTISSRLSMGTAGFGFVGGSIGIMQVTFNASTTTSGQTTYGVFIGSSTRVMFDDLFTTPQTLPNGAFQPITVIAVTYSRTLTNP